MILDRFGVRSAKALRPQSPARASARLASPHSRRAASAASASLAGRQHASVPAAGRRLLIAAPLLLGACSVLNQPNIPIMRYALSPRRPDTRQAPRGAGVLQLRGIRGAAGVQDVGLRTLQPDGAIRLAPYDEWIAPPGELTEAALRAWLSASGLFSAVVSPGSRADATLVLEGELTSLEAVPYASEARAGLAGVLLLDRGGTTRVLMTFNVTGSAPLAADADEPTKAAAMQAALGQAFTRLEDAMVSGLRR